MAKSRKRASARAKGGSELDPDRITTDKDSVDFRDLLYRPSLSNLGVELWPNAQAMHIRDQGEEGACAGFGLAAVIDYQNELCRIECKRVSARMLYEMGKRHDRWGGSSYAGTSARGVMKGWYKNGVCGEFEWPYSKRPGYFTRKRAQAALQNPLGAYYRVLPRRPDVHAALTETGAVFATAATHAGWDSPRRGQIPWKATQEATQGPGHAFAILGYTAEGFLIQNSWGPDWSKLRGHGEEFPGLALWSYADFDAHVWDLWVARRARPVESFAALDRGWMREGNTGLRPTERSPAQYTIRDQYVHLDDGAFNHNGNYPSDPESLRESVRLQLRNPKTKHLWLYAHGGLNTVKASARRVERWKPVLEANGIYGLHFIWETGLWAELKDVLLGREAAAKQRAGGVSYWWDRFIEKSTGWAGRALWKEMRSGADLAFSRQTSGGSQTLRILIEEWRALPPKSRPKWHLAGHSAGAIFFGAFARTLAAPGRSHDSKPRATGGRVYGQAVPANDPSSRAGSTGAGPALVHVEPGPRTRRSRGRHLRQIPALPGFECLSTQRTNRTAARNGRVLSRVSASGYRQARPVLSPRERSRFYFGEFTRRL